MFTSLKNFIDSRLGRGIVLDDFSNDAGFFIRISSHNLLSVAFFLKNDPDLRLALLDQIILLPPGFLWPAENSYNEIVYQLQSIKLPYRVSVTIIDDGKRMIQSLTSLYAGAEWHEDELRAQGCNIEESGENI